MINRKPNRFHPLYCLWKQMIGRCHRKSHEAYKNYGGRGVYVCDRWRFDFKQFAKDIGKRPKGMTVDRIDNDGPYAPFNCKWSSRKDQARNKRGNLLLTFSGRTQCLSEWAEEIGLSACLLSIRVKRWGIEKAFTTPKNPSTIKIRDDRGRILYARSSVA